MQARFLLGPAGSGKTRRCLDEIRDELRRAPERGPLLLLAPKQATFQLERQLLADPETPGYTRLQILSFDRLAQYILDESMADDEPGGSPGVRDLLSEQGRVMVLRAVLAEKQPELEAFRQVARLSGFAPELSSQLRDLQQHQLGPERLAAIAAKLPPPTARKLRDLAVIQQAYSAWLSKNRLTDGDCLLELAAEALRKHGRNFGKPDARGSSSVVSGQWSVVGGRSPVAGDHDNQPLATDSFGLAGLWLDGFAEMTPAELDLLAALMPFCHSATLAFCLEDQPRDNPHWLSIWSVVARTFRSCHQRIAVDGGVKVEVLARDPSRSRFSGSPVLGHLERHWTDRRPWKSGAQESLRAVACSHPEAEATLAAEEILRHVRSGGRYRDCAVLLRSLDGHHDSLRRIFGRFDIPFFLDRREPVAHHPLAELTRYSLRTVSFGWKQDDWFGVLKTGLLPADQTGIDRLENEALARGWEGAVWGEPLRIPEDPGLGESLERIRLKLTPPFLALGARIEASGFQPTGAQLADFVRELWGQLEVERQLDDWSVPSELEPADRNRPSLVHATVWDQMLDWLDNLERAFPTQALPMRDWLAIIDAGLSGLTVGVVPPALDQVLVGAVDRSRNPDLKLVIVPGLNEAVFPQPPRAPALLTEEDRDRLEGAGAPVGTQARLRLGHERYLAYIAFTRSSGRLVLSYSRFDLLGHQINPSPLLDEIRGLFPDLAVEEFVPRRDWRRSVHASELIAPILRIQRTHPGSPGLAEITKWPPVFAALGQLNELSPASREEALSPHLAERLYGPALLTSVTRLEKFAECSFRYLVNSGLRARERLRFEVDTRQTGSFQHEVLKRFHEALRAEGLRWRDVAPAVARERIRVIGGDLQKTFGGGVLDATESARFVARNLTSSLQDFIEVIVGWMSSQYEFTPAAAELRFGPEGDLPAWKIQLAGGQQLVFTGVIDRVDLLVAPDRSLGLAVVIDYKSSAKKIDARLLENGVQLQLPAYLSVLRNVPEAGRAFGIGQLRPVGVFYVSLAGHHRSGSVRSEVFEAVDEARRLAYQHHGRFDLEALPHLDNRPPDAGEQWEGDQFNYRLNKDGGLRRGQAEPMSGEGFRAMLDRVEVLLRDAGERIFAGEAKVNPYRHGSKTPCEFCDYRPVCRIDPWTHEYRALREPEPSP